MNLGRMPLHISCSLTKNLRVVVILLKHHADVNARDFNGNHLYILYL